MRVPRLRFTVRWMMIAVAMVAILFGVIRLRRVSEAHAELARSWRESVSLYRPYRCEGRVPHTHPPREWMGKSIPVSDRQCEYRKAVADYCLAMQVKYEHAARYPWLSVAPDPPEPVPDRSGPPD